MEARTRGAAQKQALDHSITIIIDGKTCHPTPFLAELIREWVMPFDPVADVSAGLPDPVLQTG